MRDEIRARIEAVKNGEVPGGYIKTEIGVLPEEWAVRPLSEISSVITDQAGEEELETLSISAGIGFVNQAQKFGKELSGKQYSKYTVLQKGDFAYNKGNSKRYPQGCTYMLRERDKAAVPNVFECFRIKEGVPEYYEQLFIHGFMNEQLAAKINHGVRDDGLLNLTDEDFYSTQLPFPTTHEQQRIAEILYTCDRAIRLKQELIDEKRKQKQSMMNRLLLPNCTDHIPGTELSQWKKVTLFDCCRRKGEYGLNAPACDYSPELPQYIRITDIDDNGQYIREAPVSVVSTEASNYYLHPGDLLFVRTGGTTGKVYHYRESDGLLVYAGFLIRFSVNTEMFDDYYIYAQFETTSYWNWVKTMSTRSGQPGINAEEYGSYSFWVPEDIKKQHEIAAAFKCIDHELHLLNNEVFAWQQKKKFLMQLLLTGLVRVNA